MTSAASRTQDVAMTRELYQQSMQHLQALAPVALVPTGRTGSCFLQSLLDSHPEVLTFNGEILFYVEFVSSSICMRAGSFAVEDVLDEFVGHYIQRFKSRYDYLERKDQLGHDRAQTLDLDTSEFRRHAVGLMGGQEASTKNLLLAVYGAYGLCLGQDLLATTVLFHHAHHFNELDRFLQDFPGASVMVTTRDPRASIVSGIENFRTFSQDYDNQSHLYTYIARVLADSEPCEARTVRYTAVRLEDLPRENTMRAVAEWLGVAFLPGMVESTWGGLHWYGDRLSPKLLAPAGWSPNRTDNNWRNRLGRLDVYVLDYLMFSRLHHYGYPCRDARWWDVLVIPILICLPLRYERRFFGPRYILRNLGTRRFRPCVHVLLTPLYYAFRVALFLRYYVRAVRGRTSCGPWIDAPRTLRD